ARDSEGLGHISAPRRPPRAAQARPGGRRSPDPLYRQADFEGRPSLQGIRSLRDERGCPGRESGIRFREGLTRVMTRSDSQHSWTRDWFYTIDGRQLPSVTTVLDVIAKPGLGPWYAKEERRYFETAMLEVLSKPGARDPEYVLAAVVEAVGGV